MSIRIVFMGTPEFAATVLTPLLNQSYVEVVACVTQPDKPSGRHMRLAPTPVKVLAEANQIPVFQPSTVRSAEFMELLVSWRPDLIITAAYGRILPQTVLDVPRLGCINVHASILPRHRGAAPVQWALLNGDRETGITIMKMETGIDTGDILMQAKCEIEPNLDTPTLMNRLAVLGAELLPQAIELFVSGKLISIPQDDTLATLSPPIRKEQGLIHWTDSSLKIHNQVRALSSWPGAYTFLNGNRFKIYQSQSLDTLDLDSAPSQPGMIVRAEREEFIVACGEGFLRLLSVQPQNSKRMDAKECAHNYRVGSFFSEENE